MRLSFWPTLAQPWPSVRDAAVAADTRGWDRVYVADHFMGDGASAAIEVPVLEATATLVMLAGCTHHVGLGTLVLSNTYRHPAAVANWAATADHLSGGRLVLGVGAGWQENEHAQYGITLPAPGERLRQFAEACAVISSLLRSPVSSLDGEFYELHNAVCEPKPQQSHLPLLIGGRRNRMLRVVARFADEWNLWADADQFRERQAELERAADEAGRDPATIRKSAQAMVLITDDATDARDFVDHHAPRAAVAGGTNRIADFIGCLRDAGADEFIVPTQHLGVGAQLLDALALIEDAAAASGWLGR